MITNIKVSHTTDTSATVQFTKEGKLCSRRVRLLKAGTNITADRLKEIAIHVIQNTTAIGIIKTPKILSFVKETLSGDLISKTHGDYGTETATLIDAPALAKASIKEQIKHATGEKKDFLEKSLENFTYRDKLFTSDYYRDLLKEKGLQGASDQYAFGVVNMWYGEVKGLGWVRHGAITDARNTLTNLEELRDPKELPALHIKGDAATIEYARNQMNDRKKALAEREVILDTQMLSLLTTHMAHNMPVDGIFKMANVSLLNENTHKVEGLWTHSEKNEMIDMATIIKDFDGATVVYGNCKGPYVERANDKVIVHMPGKGDDFKLEWKFFNLAVQGSKKSRETQNRLNGEVLESSYQGAEDLLVDLKGRGYNISGNCQSGKDRTGIIFGRVALRLLKADMEKFTPSIFEADSISKAILKRNTGWRGYKVDPFKIPGSLLSRIWNTINYIRDTVSMKAVAVTALLTNFLWHRVFGGYEPLPDQETIS